MPHRRDIEERAFRFACRVVRFCLSLMKRHPELRPLTYQLMNAGTSIGANLEEATAGQTKADFIAKTCIARKESLESRYWLRLIAECAPDTGHAAGPLTSEATEFVAILTTIVKNARSSPSRG